MNSHRINRVWACLYTPTLCLPRGRRTHTNNCCGIGSVVNSQLLLITQHKLTQLPTCSGQLRCNTTPVCKLHQQTVGVHGAAAVRGLDPQMDGFTHNRNHVQSSPTALSGSPTWSPTDDLFLERGRDFLLTNWRETHFQASRAAHLAYNLIIDEEGREQMQLLRSFNVNKIKCFQIKHLASAVSISCFHLRYYPKILEFSAIFTCKPECQIRLSLKKFVLGKIVNIIHTLFGLALYFIGNGLGES